MRSLTPRATKGWLTAGQRSFPCALGRSGIVSTKREGDGATPRGRFRFEEARFRNDRIARPQAAVSLKALRTDDGWCDAPTDRNYNRPVQHPYPASAERMWRADGLYDLVLILDYNRRPRRRHAGSAIFMHVAGDGLAPTEGCIALRRHDLLRLLPQIDRKTRLVIV